MLNALRQCLFSNHSTQSRDQTTHHEKQTNSGHVGHDRLSAVECSGAVEREFIPLVSGDIVCMMQNHQPYHVMLIVDDPARPLVHSSASERIRGAVQQSMRGLTKTKLDSVSYEVFRLTDSTLQAVLPAVDEIAQRTTVSTGSAQFHYCNANTPRQQAIELPMPFGSARLTAAEKGKLLPFTEASLYRALRAYTRAEHQPMRPYQQPSYRNALGEQVPEKTIDQLKAATLSKNKGLSCSQFLTLVFQAAIIKTKLAQDETSIAPTLSAELNEYGAGRLKAKQIDQHLRQSQIHLKNIDPLERQALADRLNQVVTQLHALVPVEEDAVSEAIASFMPIFSWDAHSITVKRLYDYLCSDDHFCAMGALDIEKKMIQPDFETSTRPSVI